MKRGLVFTLCALAVAASGSVAHAQLGATDVALSLNLRYTDPADPSEGGTWYLVGRTGSADGIAGVSAYIQNINTVGMVLGNGGTAGNGYAAVTAANIGSIVQTAPNSPYNGTFSGFVNIVYGQDTAAGPIVLDVGNGGAAGLVALDPLKNAAWNNAALLASGTFGATRPVFGTTGTTATAANVLPVGATTTPPANTALAGTNLSGANLVVRGDSVASFALNANPLAGLERGDADRDFDVDGDDFDLLAFNFGPGTGKTWGQGDFNDSGIVDGDDFDLLAFNFGAPNGVAPVSAVPEPAAAALLALAMCGLRAVRRRS